VTSVRALIVDDSVVVRHLVSEALGAEPEIEVAGVAADGKIGLAKIDQVNPDIVILDVEMPVMDGLTTLVEIRRRRPTLPVIMFSTLTQRGAAITVDALAMGASDYVTKPRASNPERSIQLIREELVPRIRGLCGIRAAPRQARRDATAPEAPKPAAGPIPPRAGPAPRVDVVAIGVSTGGPNALASLVPALPAKLPVPVVIVQHMPPMFTKILAERLDAGSPLHVVEARDGDEIRAGGVWIAPGGLHMIVERSGLGPRIRTNQDPPENSCRPSVEPLFRSVATVYGEHVLAAVLTGMGSDGLRGSEQIRRRGGQVLAQDEATSVVWGMPGFVAKAGLADAILPLQALPAAILDRVAVGRGLLAGVAS